MKKLVIAIIATLIIPVSAMAQETQIQIVNAYSFATKQTMPAAAMFMTITNTGDATDKLVAVTASDVSGRTELHTMAMDNDIMKMRQVDGYDVPANGEHVLKPMEDHVMIFDLQKDLVDGDVYKATATFEKAGDIEFDVMVKSRADMMKHMH